MNTAFEKYFLSLYGERWPGLKAALLSPESKISRSCFEGHAEYRMDAASIVAAQVLGVKTGDQVLDLCAAPGGKSLVLLEALGDQGLLTANELSYSRRKRLELVLTDHVPESSRPFVKVTGYDGNRFGLKRAGEFDRVLVDVPCSSERHLLHQDPSMKSWTLSRTQQLARRQYSLLCSAILSLKAGGRLLYSTCSISPAENDEVIERALKRKSDQVQLADCDESLLLNGFEKTEFGYQMFPDRVPGAGPIYFSCLLRK